MTTDGRETNLGRICGKREFGSDFTVLNRKLIASERAQRNRETLETFKNRLPSIRHEVQQLRHEPLGADWMRLRIRSLTGHSSILPLSITNAVRQIVRNGNGAIMIQRALTKEERDARAAAAAASATGNRQARVDTFIDEQVGQLEGYAALATDDPLRTATRAVEDFLDTLEKADIDSLADRDLRALAKLSADVEPSLDRLRETVAAGRRLLTQQNVRQLARFAITRSDTKLFDHFLKDLPA